MARAFAALRTKSCLRRFVMRPRGRAACTVGARMRRMCLRVWRLALASAVIAAMRSLRPATSRFTARALRKSGAFDQRIDGRRLELQPFTALDCRRHRNDAVTRADQAADHDAQRFEDASHLAITSFPQHDA